MSRIEDLLRAATRETAADGRYDSIPNLDLSGVARPRRSRLRLMMKARSPLGPLIIGATVALVAVVAVAVRFTQLSRPSGSDAAPPYYLSLTPVGSQPFHQSATLTVHSTHGGEVLDTVKPPSGYTTFTLVAGTADVTTFLVAAVKTGPKNAIMPNRLFRLHYQPSTNSVSLAVLPVPPVTYLDTASLSPDGQYLAVATDPRLWIYNLRTGAQHSWTAGDRSAYLTWSHDPQDISWTADDKTLSLIWTNQNLGAELRLLNTDNRGNDLSHDSRGLIRLGMNGFTCTSDPFISADGSVVMCGGFTNRSKNSGWPYPTGVVTTGFGEFSATTGRMVAILDPDRQRLPTMRTTETNLAQPKRETTVTVVDQSKLPRLYWSSPDASTLIGTRNGKAFIFRDGQEQTIPWSASLQTPWWTPATGIAW